MYPLKFKNNYKTPWKLLTILKWTFFPGWVPGQLNENGPKPLLLLIIFKTSVLKKSKNLGSHTYFKPNIWIFWKLKKSIEKIS